MTRWPALLDFGVLLAVIDGVLPPEPAADAWNWLARQDLELAVG